MEDTTPPPASSLDMLMIRLKSKHGAIVSQNREKPQPSDADQREIDEIEFKDGTRVKIRIGNAARPENTVFSTDETKTEAAKKKAEDDKRNADAAAIRGATPKELYIVMPDGRQIPNPNFEGWQRKPNGEILTGPDGQPRLDPNWSGAQKTEGGVRIVSTKRKNANGSEDTLIHIYGPDGVLRSSEVVEGGIPPDKPHLINVPANPRTGEPAKIVSIDAAGNVKEIPLGAPSLPAGIKEDGRVTYPTRGPDGKITTESIYTGARSLPGVAPFRPDPNKEGYGLLERRQELSELAKKVASSGTMSWDEAMAAAFRQLEEDRKDAEVVHRQRSGIASDQRDIWNTMDTAARARAAQSQSAWQQGVQFGNEIGQYATPGSGSALVPLLALQAGMSQYGGGAPTPVPPAMREFMNMELPGGRMPPTPAPYAPEGVAPPSVPQTRGPYFGPAPFMGDELRRSVGGSTLPTYPPFPDAPPGWRPPVPGAVPMPLYPSPAGSPDPRDTMPYTPPPPGTPLPRENLNYGGQPPTIGFLRSIPPPLSPWEQLGFSPEVAAEMGMLA